MIFGSVTLFLCSWEKMLRNHSTNLAVWKKSWLDSNQAAHTQGLHWWLVFHFSSKSEVRDFQKLQSWPNHSHGSHQWEFNHHLQWEHNLASAELNWKSYLIFFIPKWKSHGNELIIIMLVGCLSLSALCESLWGRRTRKIQDTERVGHCCLLKYYILISLLSDHSI